MADRKWLARSKAASLRRNLHALYLAARHREVSWVAKLVIGLVVAYALSPIDLVPDFIPVLGWLDDLVLVPLGLWLAIRLIPVDIWRECQARAHVERRKLRKSMTAAVIIVLLWIGLAAAVGWWVLGSAGG